MKKNLEYIHDMLVAFQHSQDELLRAQHEQAIISARQEENLKEHMRRTELLELTVSEQQKSINMVHGAIAFIGIVGILIGIWAAIK